MTKKDLISQVAKNLNLTQKEVGKVLDEAFGCIGDALYNKEDLIIKDFGTFSVKLRKERTGMNPSTRQKIIVPAKEVVKFKPASKICFYSRKL